MTRMRLDKYLAKCGLGSRADARKLIRSGQVAVAGVRVKDCGHILNPHTAAVTHAGQPLRYQEFCYLLLNKPAGFISASRDGRQATVLDLLPQRYRRLGLFPVGRLDKDSQGLLLLTNDGQLAHSLLAPKRRTPKTYRVRVSGRVGERERQAFAQGIDLSDFTALPATLVVLKAGEESLVDVTLHEGKYHQVKRMFHALGNEVLSLTRTSMGPLTLPADLALGSARELTAAELALLEEWR